MRFPLDVVQAVRAAWPPERPLFVRISASDWLEGAGAEAGAGMTPDDAVVVARALAAAGVDVVDVSSGGNTPRSQVAYGRMYQVPFADRIRHEAGVCTMAVGGAARRRPREHRAGRRAAPTWPPSPAGTCSTRYLTLQAAAQAKDAAFAWPKQYRPARPF